MTNQPSRPTSSEGTKSVRPYPPSWVDRLIDAVAKLPGPTWLAYLGGLLTTLLFSHAVRWIDGSLPVGSVDILRVAEATLVVVFPAVQQYLNNTARTALDGFRPALQVSEDEYAALRYQLTTVPRRPGVVLGVIGAAFGLLSLLSQPLGYSATPRPSCVAIILSVFFAMLTTAFVAVFIYHTLRQLRLVGSLHSMAEHINLFQLAPAHSLSTLTSRTGIAIILITSFGYIFVFFASASGGGIAAVYVVIMVFMFLVALASFALPLKSMHDRLSHEKIRALAEVNRRLETTIRTVHDQLDKGEFHTMDQMEKALANLMTERQVLTEVSTWPWRRETFRGFISSLALPIILYIITTVLGGILGL